MYCVRCSKEMYGFSQRKWEADHREEINARGRVRYATDAFKEVSARRSKAKYREDPDRKKRNAEQYERQKELALPGTAHKKKWTPEEDRTLRELYPVLSLWEIALRMGRTWGAIRGRSYKLQIEYKNKRYVYQEKGR